MQEEVSAFIDNDTNSQRRFWIVIDSRTKDDDGENTRSKTNGVMNVESWRMKLEIESVDDDEDEMATITLCRFVAVDEEEEIDSWTKRELLK